MRILFIHSRFPGPFRFIAQALGAMPGAKVLFLAERGRRDLRLPKVRRLAIPLPPLPVREQPRESAEQESDTMLHRASATANALLRLRREGFVPDIIYSAPPGGHSLYVHDVYPQALHVTYANWFHAPDESFSFFHADKSRSPVDFAAARIQNLLQYNALMESQLNITSTLWQKNQYPEALAKTITVCSEGVDTAFFTPDPPGSPDQKSVLPASDELVTYAWTDPAAFAGAPQFMASLPRLLEARPRCLVGIIATATASRSAADKALQELPDTIRQRVCIFSPATPEGIRGLLRMSSVHVYLTPPFTLTSLLYEALSCQCLVVGSDTAPVREVITHGQNGLLTDFWNSDALADTVAQALKQRKSAETQAMRVAARQTMRDGHDLRTCTEKHMHLLLDAFRQHEAAK